MKKPGIGLASLRMSFMGRSAPGAAGGAGAAAVGGEVTLSGVVAVAAGGVCACEALQANKQINETASDVSLKLSDFIAITAMRIP